MKSIVAVLLTCQILMGSLLPGFGIDQSARLVDLVQHYQQHRQTEPDLGFLDFMEMHYGATSEHHKHPNHSHHNLPSVGHFVPALLLSSLRLCVKPVTFEILEAKAIFWRKADLYSFQAVYALINPPQS